MQMLKSCMLLLALSASVQWASAQQTYSVQSPDGHLSATVLTGAHLSYSVQHDQQLIIAPSGISLQLETGETLGVPASVRSSKKNSVQQTITPPVYKRKTINDQYNELTLAMKGDYSVVFRAYNEGVAYRFVTSKKTDFNIVKEEATFKFTGNDTAWVPYVNADSGASFEQQFFNSFENTYTVSLLGNLDAKRLNFLPMAVNAGKGIRVAITEADLESYPGMYLNNADGTQTLKGVFAPYPKDVVPGGYNMYQGIVKSREPFIAKCKGARTFPWRVIAVTTEDGQLADNDLVYKLAAPSRLEDVSWIKPGKVAWDWWNDWNVYGVDFRAGINNDTYKYYIDFAAAHHLEYIVMDEGWSVGGKVDLFQIVPEIDMPALVAYGKEKGVGIILWAGNNAFNKDMERVCKYFSEMGIKGFKVDFMDRDDQQMVEFYYRAAATAAKYKLVMDFHGAYKPTGLQRTYPNAINFEGVHGLEQLKWGHADQVTNDVSIPFMRMLAGPLDYTPGAMRNATKGNFAGIGSEPMSQGTRCHQLAEYIVFEAPLQMLCDAPSNYMREEECTQFISGVPTVWDNTVAVNGKIGQYISMARQSGKVWYVGALNDWHSRKLPLDLSFLGAGHYKMEIFKDGINADRAARDYKREVIDVPEDRQVMMSLYPGGGFAARIYAE